MDPTFPYVCIYSGLEGHFRMFMMGSFLDCLVSTRQTRYLYKWGAFILPQHLLDDIQKNTDPISAQSSYPNPESLLSPLSLPFPAYSTWLQPLSPTLQLTPQCQLQLLLKPDSQTLWPPMCCPVTIPGPTSKQHAYQASTWIPASWGQGLGVAHCWTPKHSGVPGTEEELRKHMLVKIKDKWI